MHFALKPCTQWRKSTFLGRYGTGRASNAQIVGKCWNKVRLPITMQRPTAERAIVKISDPKDTAMARVRVLYT